MIARREAADPIVTAVNALPRRRGRVQICVDGEPALEISRELACEHGLRPGARIAQAALDALALADARKRALSAAAALLARRARSERELRQSLARRKLPAAVVDETVKRLRAMKLIDDAAFASAWAESRDQLQPRARRLIAAELRAKGVATEIAQESAAATVDDADAAYRLASARARALRACDYPAFESRLGNLLLRRGFGYGLARATVRRCWDEMERPAAVSAAGAE